LTIRYIANTLGLGLIVNELMLLIRHIRFLTFTRLGWSGTLAIQFMHIWESLQNRLNIQFQQRLQEGTLFSLFSSSRSVYSVPLDCIYSVPPVIAISWNTDNCSWRCNTLNKRNLHLLVNCYMLVNAIKLVCLNLLVSWCKGGMNRT
jgi:hypothetical protein